MLWFAPKNVFSRVFVGECIENRTTLCVFLFCIQLIWQQHWFCCTWAILQPCTMVMFHITVVTPFINCLLERIEETKNRECKKPSRWGAISVICCHLLVGFNLLWYCLASYNCPYFLVKSTNKTDFQRDSDLNMAPWLHPLSFSKIWVP